MGIWIYITCIYICVLSQFSHVQLFATPWTITCQVPLFMGFSQQEYWSEFPCPLSGDHPNPGIKPISPASPAMQADSLSLSHQGSPHIYIYGYTYPCVLYVCI